MPYGNDIDEVDIVAPTTEHRIEHVLHKASTQGAPLTHLDL